MKNLWKMVPHLLIVLSLTVLGFLILDWYNPYMNFLGLWISTILIITFCLLSLMQSARTIFDDRPQQKLPKHPPKRGSRKAR